MQFRCEYYPYNISEYREDSICNLDVNIIHTIFPSIGKIVYAI